MPGLIRVVLAHDWGWDEILYFGVPVAIVLFWVRWAEKRATARKEAAKAAAAETGSEAESSPEESD